VRASACVHVERQTAERTKVQKGVSPVSHVDEEADEGAGPTLHDTTRRARHLFAPPSPFFFVGSRLLLCP
jgi:hypothetical protein